jgi:hypothetical protein
VRRLLANSYSAVGFFFSCVLMYFIFGAHDGVMSVMTSFVVLLCATQVEELTQT